MYELSSGSSLETVTDFGKPEPSLIHICLLLDGKQNFSQLKIKKTIS